MSSQVSEQELGDALLHAAQHGSFPHSEHVSSAPVASAALPKLRQTLEKARDDTKEQIRQVSREAASDVDGWMTQARKLQADIKRSQETAKEIVQQAESGQEKTAQVQDAAAKLSFLHAEIAYNESLVHVVEQLKDISTLLESAQDAAAHSHILHALDRLEDADGAFKRLGPFENTRAVGLLKTKLDQLRSAIVENVTETWNSLLLVNTAERKITLKEEVEREHGMNIGTAVKALTRLGLLDSFIARLSRDFDSVIVQPRLAIGPDQVVSALTIRGDDIQVVGQVNTMSVQAALEDIQAIAEYLSTHTPAEIAVPLSEKLVTVIANRLISNWLLPAIPLSTKGIPDFQETLSLVLGLVEFFDELGWSGQQRLTEWVDKSADKWLGRQKEAAIAQVQRIFPIRVKDKKTVERVETQVLSKGDAMLGGHEERDEDWGTEWGDDEEATEPPTNNNEIHQSQVVEEEEEDISAWGIDEDDPQKPQIESEASKPAPQSEEDTEDWGADWGDEEETKQAAAEPAPQSSAEPKANSQYVKSEKPSRDREMTLRETYTVTAIPDAIIEMILQAVTDVGTLNTPGLVGSAIAPASGGLFAIPSLLLAMYRATAATHYSRDIAANMLIYNDCTRLSDGLRAYIAEQVGKDHEINLPHHLKPSVRLKPRLEQDIKAIEVFGKRAYGREMESQRTIIRDHLDAAQGFSSCTKMPFAAECDNAIAMAIDRIADVKNAWKPVLSHSALLQSLGSLVSTALSKFIADIEDMTDIAEDESKKLRGYCISLSSLSALFITEDDDGQQRDMTSVYTPNWFKFQYLSEILDSSLADIKYMWTDGELKLEMEVDEVLDLIKALFAESDYRRKAIADIRRVAGH